MLSNIFNKFKILQITFNYRILVKIMFLLILYYPLYPSSITINGIIKTTTSSQVQNAQINFINIVDTTKQFSAITDSTGKYRINISATSIQPEDIHANSIELSQNYPNPFFSSTSIPYKINVKTNVEITIYDLVGRRIKKMNVGYQQPGQYSILWNGKNDLGKKVSTGIYICRLQAGKETQIKKMVVMEGTVTNNIQIPIINPNISKVQTQKSIQSFSEIYDITINNTDTIEPFIFPTHLENIEINGDTTLNFEVNNYGSWKRLDIITSQTLRDIDFVDDHNGWAVGDSGTILHTVNGGDTWHQQVFPFTQLPGYEDREDQLFAVEFIDSTNGFIASTNSIFKTDDCGNTWNIKYTKSPDNGRFYDIEFLNSKIGFAVGGSFFDGISLLLKTIDGGDTWIDITPANCIALTNISTLDSSKIWICGVGSSYLYSADSGASWIQKDLESSLGAYFSSVQFISDQIGWLGGDHNSYYGNRLLRTTDGGNTWIKTSREDWSFRLYGVNTLHFTNSQNGWIGTFLNGSYAIAQTINGGKTWEFLPSAMVERNDLEYVGYILKIVFIEQDFGWAVGMVSINHTPYGTILRYERDK